MGRRRRSSGGEFFIGLFIAAAIAIAVFGVYLLAIAVIALVGWLAQQVIKQTQARGGAPKISQAMAPTTAAAPEHQYHEVISVSPTAFDDQQTAASAAVRVFAAWAARLPKAPKDASDAVRSLQVRRRLIGRLVTHVEGRRFEWRTAPYGGRERAGAPPVDGSTLDPWHPPDGLKKSSRYIASCWTCHGDGRVVCVKCGGAGRVGCTSCDGSGKYYGTTANGAQRLLNCKTCRGKGDVVCGPCTRGQVECPTCHRSKKLEAWLEVDASQREDVQIEPDGQVTRAYRWGTDGVSATRTEIERDANVVGEVTHARGVTADEIAKVASDEWVASFYQAIQPAVGPGEKVLSQTFTLLEVPSIDLGYAVGGETQVIELHGRRMLAPPVTTDQLFARRARSLRRMAYVLAALPLAAGVVYLARGTYFHSAEALGVVAAAAAVAVLIYAAMWHATAGRRSARRWLGATVAPIGAAVALAIFAEPSAGAARSYIEKGQLDAARAELAALGDREDADRAELWADLALQETLGETDSTDARTKASEVPAGTPQDAQANAHLDALVLAEAETALKGENYAAVRARVDVLSEAGRQGDDARKVLALAALGEATACAGQANWDCAFQRSDEAKGLGLEKEAAQFRTATIDTLRVRADQMIALAAAEKELRPRVAAQDAAIKGWADYDAVVPTPEPAGLVTVRKQHERDAEILRKQDERDRIKREAEERRAAAKAAAEEKKRLAAEAREQTRQERAEKRSFSRERSCCKVCSSGCPCGDSCISCSKTCRKGPGCAC